jgi:hypothetical protein
MLNLTPNSPNNLVIYADTVTQSAGDYFLMEFTNAYSREPFLVIPSVVRRNTRFVELEITLVGVDGQDLPLAGDIYLYPDGDFDYVVTNIPSLTLAPTGGTEIDRGQAFLYAEIPCEREVEFVPYVSDNEFLRNIVYVTGVLPFQFPCTIQAYTTFTVENNTTTYCPIITVENNAILVIDQGITLQQQFSPYETC